MTLASRTLERYFDLPPAAVRAVRVTRDIHVPMRDGAVLHTHHYEPRLRPAATILVRTPYGINGIMGLLSGRVLAERGYHVVLQSCRGTFDSDGVFEPMVHEREDGLDTIAWIKNQPWFDGNLFTYGSSYVGFTQWAVAAEAGAELKGMVPAITTSGFRDPTYAGGAYSLDTILNWAAITANQGVSLPVAIYRQARAQKRLRRAMVHLPLSEVDTQALGAQVPFFQEWLTHSAPDDEYWARRIHVQRVRDVDAAVELIGGWYDIFLPWQLKDYAAMRAAGKYPRLVVGPWTHNDPKLFGFTMREALRWFRDVLDGRQDERGGVQVYVGGAEEWRELPDWPPAAGTTEWFLGAGGALTTKPPVDSGPDHFHYDPADPTPSPGGPLLNPDAGRKDNRAVEARADVLVYTSAPLAEPYEAIGPVTATIHTKSSLEYFDVQVRFCEVDLAGRSENVSDGLVRVVPGLFPPDADGVRAVEVELWPTAYRFRAGHRLRVQLAGGAHPRHARNTGTGEPLATATRLLASDNEVYHDPAHPSALRLPG